MKPITKLLIILGVFLLLPSLGKPESKTIQTVVPECFERADCIRPITKNYCNVIFDCIQGKCFTSDVLCQETCNSGIDDDLDGLVDCDDDDCWDDIACHCSIMSFTKCLTNRCYCESGTPRWFVGPPNYCFCVG